MRDGPLCGRSGFAGLQKQESNVTLLCPVRRLVLRMMLGVLIATLPLRLEIGVGGGWGLGIASAQAESGPGRDGDGGDDDRGGHDDDDDDRDDDRDDDDRDDDHRGDDDDRDDERYDDRGGGRDDDRDAVSMQATGSGDSLHLQYSNGWQEWVRDGRYVLLDPEGQTVSNRAATREDLARMRAAAGL